MLLSMFLSFLLARKFGSRNYVGLVTILVILASFFSLAPLPVSFPFYVPVILAGIGPGFFEYSLYFLTFEISSVTTSSLMGCSSFFLLVNIVGAVIGYWMSKSKKLTGIFQDEV